MPLMGYVCWTGVQHHVYRMFLLHMSTVFLNLRRVDFGSSLANGVVDVSFCLSFIFLRLLLLPMWWLRFLAFGLRSDPAKWGKCMNAHVLTVAALGGAVVLAL